MTQGNLAAYTASAMQAALAAPRVLPPAGTGGGGMSAPLPAGYGRYRVFDALSGDVAGGPTHQPGVMPGHGYEALRTPFGQTGTPGEGRERNVTNLELAPNHHPDGDPFAAPNGRGTRQVPAMPRLRRKTAR